MSHLSAVEFILYVADQERSRNFYASLLGNEASLDVPGMTEFELSAGCRLGLMPANGIASIIGSALPHPSLGHGIPRAELYLRVNDVDHYFTRALRAGALSVSPPQDRDWGDAVAYVADPDGHIIAFAMPLNAK